jgi:hypothetical protein
MQRRKAAVAIIFQNWPKTCRFGAGPKRPYSPQPKPQALAAMFPFFQTRDAASARGSMELPFLSVRFS